MKDFSLWSPDDISNWLSSIGLMRYQNNFLNSNVTGYDLCYLTSDDFKALGISNIHDKNVLIKQIRLQTLEQLKLLFSYEGKEVQVQLDFDSNFTVFELENYLKDLFQIQSPIHLSTESNEALCPNIKIIELLLLNPQKYKHLQIFSRLPKFPPIERSIEEDNHIKSYNEMQKFSYDTKEKEKREYTTINNNHMTNENSCNSYRQRNPNLNMNIIENSYSSENKYEHPAKYQKYRDNGSYRNDDVEEENVSEFSNSNNSRGFTENTPQKFGKLNRNSSALMPKPGLALNMNYNRSNRKYNRNYESTSNRNDSNSNQDESTLNYDYKQDYTNNWGYNDTK